MLLFCPLAIAGKKLSSEDSFALMIMWTEELLQYVLEVSFCFFETVSFLRSILGHD